MPLTRPPTTSTLPKLNTTTSHLMHPTTSSATATRHFTTSAHASPFVHPSLNSTGTAATSSSPTRKIAAAGAAAGILLCGVGAASRAGARAVGRRGVASFEGQGGKTTTTGGMGAGGVGAVAAVQHESRRKLGEAAAERQEWAIRQGTDVFW
ncbi:hypothetical protein BC567DRAFT_261915 [Phyllosticta citribraziliensis]